MHTRNRAIIALCAALVLVPALLALTATPIRAQEKSFEKMAVRGIGVSLAVGKAMAGQAEDKPMVKVAFSYKPKASDFLSANNAELAHVQLATYGDEQLTGVFTYTTSLGLNAYYGYVIDYAEAGPDSYQVKGTDITPFEPMAPAAEPYFIPASRMSLKDMKAMSVPDLLAYARENTDRVLADAPAGSVKDYIVLAFCMDRLMDGAKWAMTSTGGTGESWSKGGWNVAAVQISFAVNGPKAEVFNLYMTRDPKSVDAGKTFLVGSFTNQYLPTLPEGPIHEVETTPAISSLLSRYQAKALPNIKE